MEISLENWQTSRVAADGASLQANPLNKDDAASLQQHYQQSRKFLHARCGCHIASSDIVSFSENNQNHSQLIHTMYATAATLGSPYYRQHFDQMASSGQFSSEASEKLFWRKENPRQAIFYVMPNCWSMQDVHEIFEAVCNF
jgi:hypothetical protein